MIALLIAFIFGASTAGVLALVVFEEDDPRRRHEGRKMWEPAAEKPPEISP